MYVKDAAYAVLKEAGRPLSREDLARRVLQKGLWNTSGKTPTNTISAALYTDMKKQGPASRFAQPQKGMFSLRDFPDEVAEEPAADQRKNLTFTDSAEKVLAEFGRGKPMHYKEITKKALGEGWLTSSGQTPESTMAALLGTENRRKERRGEHPRFVLHGRDYGGGPGYVSLNRMEGLAAQIEDHNKKVRNILKKQVLNLRPGEFESLISRLLSEMGFIDVEVTRVAHDRGIDVRGTLAVGDVIRIKMAVQAKKWTAKNVQAPEVQKVRGSLGAHEQGLIITTSNFSQGARKEAKQRDKNPIALMNGDQLVALLMEHRIGVNRSTQHLFEFDAPSLSGTDFSDHGNAHSPSGGF